MQKYNTFRLLELCANYCFDLQKSNGSLPSGNNGPYNDPETPVRNTAHFLFLLADLFQKTGDARYQEAGKRAIEYLFSPSARPWNSSFHCRDKKGKDRCNGLVGQAWVIEALVRASEAFGRSDCYDLAEKVFLLHPWDKNTALWRRVDIDGKVLIYDNTFNHQLWFAAAGTMLQKTPVAKDRSLAFFRKVATRVQLYPDNVIFHLSPMGNALNFLKNGPVSLTQEIIRRLKKIQKRMGYIRSLWGIMVLIYTLMLY